MGGLATSRTGGGNQTNIFEADGSGWTNTFDSTKSAVSPYSGNIDYEVDGSGNLDADGNSYILKVAKDVNHEPEDFYE